MRIAVIDDDQNIINQVEKIIIEYMKLKNSSVDISAYTSAEEFISTYKSNKSMGIKLYYDAIFLDIEMGELSGIEFAKMLRNEIKNFTTQIIYITSHMKFMKDAFDTVAFGFLEKPLEESRIKATIDRLLEYIINSELTFNYSKASEIRRVLVRDIEYLEVDNRTIYLCEKDGIVHEFYGTLQDSLKKLPQDKFVQINRSVIVNINYIKRLDSHSLELYSNKILSVGKSYYYDVLEKI